MIAAMPHLSRLSDAPGAAADREEANGRLYGVARHVTADGCQFAITGPRPAAGCHLTCRLSANAAVTGVVRWIVEDRIGFAFDRLLDAGSLAELARHCLQVKALALEAAG